MANQDAFNVQLKNLSKDDLMKAISNSLTTLDSNKAWVNSVLKNDD